MAGCDACDEEYEVGSHLLVHREVERECFPSRVWDMFLFKALFKKTHQQVLLLIWMEMVYKAGVKVKT